MIHGRRSRAKMWKPILPSDGLGSNPKRRGAVRSEGGWSRDAGRDRDDIFNHIAADNFAAAVANGQKLAAAEMQLTHFPQSGRTGRVEETRELAIPGTPFT